MDYSFNQEVAKKYGVDGAVLIQNLYFWIKKNKANNEHFHDGHYWTYNSTRAFAELFPFWTTNQIGRILRNLKEAGALLTGNYNKSNYDRTAWYALADSVISIYEGGDFHFDERENGNVQTHEPIPDNNPYREDKIYTHARAEEKPDSPPRSEYDGAVSELCQYYQELGGVSTTIVIDDLVFYLGAGIEPEAVREAMRKAARAGARWTYAETVLKNWKRDGIKTMRQVKALDENKAAKFPPPKIKETIETETWLV